MRADIERPITRRAKARACPMRIGPRRLEAASGTRPSLVKRVENVAPLAATT
jgi:hypothetical protein